MPKKPSPRWEAYLWIALVGIVLLSGWGFIALVTMLGHKTYVVSGRAHIPADAVSHVPLPALLCSGTGGPLDSSAVFGLPLGFELDRPPAVFCRRPEQDRIIEYRVSLYYGKKPRRMHAYVWLETHEELASACENASTAMIAVEGRQLKGNPYPCWSTPDPAGSLGYTVAFSNLEGPDEEEIDIEVKANAPFPR